MLNSRIFSEIYPMRKTVIDGSNTTGFQRTMLISDGGFFDVEGKKNRNTINLFRRRCCKNFRKQRFHKKI